MKTVSMTTIAFVVALLVIAFDAMGAAKAGPIITKGYDCLEHAEGGTDCSFTSYAQYEAAAEYYRSTVLEDEHLR